MGKIAGIPYLRAVKALEKAGFRVARQGKHIVMTDGVRILTIPRHDQSMLTRWRVSCAMQGLLSSDSANYYSRDCTRN